MKVIDLLNKIANGEEVKFKITETDEVLNLTKDMNLFSVTHNEPVKWFIDEEWLNYEVEIIEEDKKIEHIENYVDFANLNDDEKFDYLYEMESRIIDKINEEK